MRYATGAALVLLAGAVWSVQGLIIRNIHTAGSWEILFWRSVGMAPVLAVWTYVQSGGRLWSEFRSVGLAGVIGGMGLVAAFSGAIFAFQATAVANAVLLFSASPFFAALLGWLILREHVRRATWGAIALAVVGVLMMVREGVAGGAAAGNIAALLSALGFATFTITLRWGKLANMMPAVVLGGLFSMGAGALVIGIQGGTLGGAGGAACHSGGRGCGFGGGGGGGLGGRDGALHHRQPGDPCGAGHAFVTGRGAAGPDLGLAVSRRDGDSRDLCRRRGAVGGCGAERADRGARAGDGSRAGLTGDVAESG